MKKSELIAQLQAEIAAFGDEDVGADTLAMLAPPSEAVQIERGNALIAVLMLKKDREHKDRVQTSSGTKTALGLFRTVRHLINAGV